jgi:GntR family transcriptional regulator, transcriptional repressor for pyruvate dehydrogenase complex
MDKKINPIKKVRVSEEVFKQLYGMIRSGAFKPGDQLPSERELSEQFEVSRASVREALRALETMGMVRSSVGVGGGNFVKEITLETIIGPFADFLNSTEKSLLEMMEFRLVLETEIARLAAERRSEEDLIAIERSLTEMQKEIQTGGIGLSGDNLFHDAVAQATHNQVFVHMLSLAKKLLVKTREASLSVKGVPQMGLSHHAKIFEAISAGNPEAAAAAMREHLVEAMFNVRKSRK